MPIRICSHRSDQDYSPSGGSEFVPSLFGGTLVLHTAMEDLLGPRTYANQRHEHDAILVGYVFSERLYVGRNSGIPQEEPLYNALNILAGAMEEARREEFVLPSYIALENARRLLENMYRISPRYYDVYPTEEGDISIDAPGGYNRSFVTLCYNDGRVLCLANINGDRKRRLYESGELLPDSFVTDALERLQCVSDGEWVV